MKLLNAAVLMTLVLAASCQSAPKTNDSPGDAAGSGGPMCGGIAALRCGAGQYCRIETGRCRTTADVAGVCTERPRICTMIYDPVCGCDGKTYPSACQAASAGASVATKGECKR